MTEIVINKKSVIKKTIYYQDIVEIDDDDYEKLVNEELSIEDIIEENEINFQILEENEEILEEKNEWEDN